MVTIYTAMVIGALCSLGVIGIVKDFREKIKNKK